MAFVEGGFVARFTIVDNSGYGTTRSYQLVAATFADAQDAVTDIQTALEAVTDGVITNVEIAQSSYQDTIVLPAAGVQVENQALLVLELEDITKSATVSVPAPKIAIFQATSGAGADIVDPTDAAVIAYVGLFNSAGPAFVSDGEHSVGLRQGHRRHVASKKH